MSILRWALGLGFLFFSTGSAKADLILNLEGSLGSSEISFEISGSLISQTNVLLGLTIDGFGPFVSSDFAFTPILPVATVEIIRNGNPIATSNISHIRSSAGGTGIVLEINPDRFVQANDLFVFSGAGTFMLPGGLTFDDFVVGTYGGNPEPGFVGAATLNISQIVATPEPGSLWVIVAAGGSIGLLRTRIRALKNWGGSHFHSK